MSIIPLQTSAETDAKPAPEDERLWSVTTILKAYGDSQGLIEWSAGAVADTAIRSEKTWKAILEDSGEAEARRWLIDSRYRPARGERSATKLGTAVHAAIETLVVTGRRPNLGDDLGPDIGIYDSEVEPYLDNFQLFLDYFQPEFTAAELTVYNPTYGYAGTLDGQAHVQGQHVVIDYKTSKKSFDGRGNRSKPWKTVALQTAAYRHAEFAAVWKARKFEQYSRRYYLLNEDERNLSVPMPQVDGGLCVHITPDHCDVYPVPTDDTVFERFLFAMENARTDFELSRGWIGEPLALLNRKAS
jgi:hypothetical protein